MGVIGLMWRFSLMVVLVASAGCSDQGFPLTPVQGKVTFGGAPCPAAGTISFFPKEVAEGLPRRPAQGRFGLDGEFQVTTFEENDGLVPGRYAVSVDCWSGAPSMEDPAAFNSASHVPRNFKPDDFVLEVGSGPVVFNLDVPKKKR